ncbi:hypothetical protein [Pseudomonas lopnurensis]|uniref:hypothetical protein n=1 Tax=Pseudomonas lopnurensis TaxID=1477517 RepID=UPI0028B01E2E|nr:hypothetical protein [Pseudomonas lopnurensis]
MVYSVQQIKFEFLSYIREFNSSGDGWFVGVCGDAEQALFDSRSVDRDKDIWLWKPALSAKAAGTVLDYFTQRFNVALATCHEPGTQANCVFLYRKGEALNPVLQ